VRHLRQFALLLHFLQKRKGRTVANLLHVAGKHGGAAAASTTASGLLLLLNGR
jgi:hypothetical protein